MHGVLAARQLLVSSLEHGGCVVLAMVMTGIIYNLLTLGSTLDRVAFQNLVMMVSLLQVDKSTMLDRFLLEYDGPA